MTSMVVGPITGTSNNKCLRREDAFTSVSLFPSTRLAARRSMASVPSIASSATQARSAIATLWPRSRLASAWAILRPYSMSRFSSESGLRFVIAPAGASSGFSSSVESTRLNSFIGQHFGHTADQRIGILMCQAGQHLDQPPIGPDRRKDLRMFHLPGHHDLRNAFAVADLDQSAQFAKRNPVTTAGSAFDIGRCFFLDRDGNGFVALFARGLEGDHGKAPVAGDDAVFHPPFIIL